MTVSEVRFSSQWAMAESGTIAPVVAAAGVVAGVAVPVLSTANGRDVTPEGAPVSVPAPMAAAVVDSLLAAAMAAMLDETGFAVLLPVPAVGVLGLMEELGLVLLEAEAKELLLPPALLLELTSCPAKVGKEAAAPAGADGVAGDGVVAAAAAIVAAVAVEPRRGTEAAAPVEPVLM